MGVVNRPRHMVHVLFHRSHRRGRPEEPFDPHSVFLYESGALASTVVTGFCFARLNEKGFLPDLSKLINEEE